jgi:hypothetical protein
MTSSPSSFEVRVGNRVWLDGQGWDICELTGELVRLRGNDSIRSVSFSMLADLVIDPPVTGDDTVPTGAWEIPAVVLAADQIKPLVRIQPLASSGNDSPEATSPTAPKHSGSTRPPPPTPTTADPTPCGTPTSSIPPTTTCATLAMPTDHFGGRPRRQLSIPTPHTDPLT